MSLQQQVPPTIAAAGAQASIGFGASDRIGAALVAGCGALTAAGIALALAQNVFAWAAGQVVLALAFLQWFILLHEAGHLTLFRSRAANRIAGHLAGFFALIPFASWRRVHGLHHLWTGWQDLDPTTASLVPRRLSGLERFIADWAWKLWLPLFSILYRLNNYWRLGRVCALFPARLACIAIRANAVALLVAYGCLFVTVGAETLLLLVGPAIFLSLALQDPLILSQHTHLPQQLSGGAAVSPVRAADQERYTRSLRFPRWVAQPLLVNFNAHELHHAQVNVPGYRLGSLAHRPRNEVSAWVWLREAKRLRGSVFLFSNRDETGFRW